MFKKLIVVTLLLSTQLCLKVKASEIKSTEEKFADYSILRESAEVIKIFKQCSRMSPSFITSYSRLDEKLVERIEKKLPKALKKLASGKTINLNDYYRQYVSFGMLKRQGVYINAIHKEAAKKWAGKDASRLELLANWQTKSLNICGGKGLHWGAIYDGSGDVISEILFNTAIKK